MTQNFIIKGNVHQQVNVLFVLSNIHVATINFT
jgi:hypothetical protein